MSVIVVTDSSSRLTADELKQNNIRQVPLHVLVDGADLRDGIDDVPNDIHDRPRATTSGASPAALTEAYRQALADSNGDGVVAVHLSAALSSTFSTAVQAAREFGPSVRVVNSRSAAMGSGLSRAPRQTRQLPARIWKPLRRKPVRRCRALTRSSLCTDWTTCGAAGGSARRRRGWARRCRPPLLCLDVDGRLVLDQRVRTLTKAHTAMVERVAEIVGEGGARIAVHHVDNHDGADEMGAALTARLPQIDSLTVTDMGPVLAIHLGAGAIGVVVQTAD